MKKPVSSLTNTTYTVYCKRCWRPLPPGTAAIAYEDPTRPGSRIYTCPNSSSCVVEIASHAEVAGLCYAPAAEFERLRLLKVYLQAFCRTDEYDEGRRQSAAARIHAHFSDLGLVTGPAPRRRFNGIRFLEVQP